MRWTWRILAGLASLALAASASAQDVQAAAAAFAQGQRAQLRGDHARAAELFELADQSAPSPEALRSAIRNHAQATQLARAATLSARALERYPDDDATRALAEETLAAAESSVGRLSVRCAPACNLTLDGRAAVVEPRDEIVLYLDPGPRELRATWTDREAPTQRVTLAAGESARVSFEGVVPEPEPEPAVEPEPEVEVEVEPEAPAPVPASSADGGGVTPVLFFVGAGLTALAGGLSIWSGLDTLSARDAYVENPTRAGYENGTALETRTNVLFFSTLGLAAVTAVLAIFTDWDDDSADVSLTVGPGGAFASLRLELDP